MVDPTRKTPKRRTPAGELQQALDETLTELPRTLTIEMFVRKLTAAAVKDPAQVAAALADHILNHDDDDVEWREEWGEPPAGLANILTISDEDMAFVDRGFHAFTEKDLPAVIADVSERASRAMVTSMKRRWAEEHARQKHDMVGFTMRMEQRWGKGFTALRMLLTCSREIGQEAHARRRKSRLKKNLYRTDVAIRLHARACQVTAEILVLMESGYADGAMARWRTLHEISVVMALVMDHDDDLARRYLIHDAVESKRSLDFYLRVYEDLGYGAPSKAEMQKVEHTYAWAIEQYGKAFGGEYGWAAGHLGLAKPTFADLEKAAGRFRMRSHYKMASQNVHAGVKGITFKLGAFGNRAAILAGASNAGLVEPGQNAAITLTQITVLLVGIKGLDELVILMALQRLQADAVDAFVKASRRLKQEEMAKAR